MKTKKFPALQVVATAVAAYEHNRRSIIRNPTTLDGVDYVSNRQLITDYVEGRGGAFRVNDIHVKQAEGIVQYLEQTVIMQSLRNTPDGFLGQLSALLANKEVTNKDFGILAWAPHLVDQYQKKDHVRELSARYERSSQYTGRIGDKITVDFTLISKHYVKTLDCYAVYGITEHDNLVFYWAKTLDKVCETGRIHGRIKAHNEDEYRGKARVTTLNYVKVL